MAFINSSYSKLFKFSKFKKDIAITIAGQIAVLIIAVGINKILSIKLGVEGFGEYNLMKKAVGVLSFVLLAGLGIAIPKYIATYQEAKDYTSEARYVLASMIIMLAMALITSIGVLIFRDSVSYLVFNAKHYQSEIVLILIYSVTLSWVTYIYSYYRGKDDFLKYNSSQILVQFLTLAGAWFFGYNITWLLMVWIIVTGTYGAFFLYKIWMAHYKKAEIRSFFKDLNAPSKELLSFCLPRIPGEFILFAFPLVALIHINRDFGLEMTAYFSVSLSLIAMVNPLFSFVGLVLLPLVSRSIVNDKFSQVSQKIYNLGKIYAAFSVIIVIFVQLLAPFIISLFFSAEYLPGVFIVKLLIFSILPNSIYLLLRNPLDAVSKTPYNTINLAISFVFLIVSIRLSQSVEFLAYSFLSSYGLLGLLTLFTWLKLKSKLKSMEQANTNL